MFRFEYIYSFTPMRPPRVSVTTFTSYICCIYTLKFGQYWTSFCIGNSSVSKCLICNFCSSDRGFALGFLQTPPHDGRPCPWLTVPTAKSVADFHRQVVTHAERTKTSAENLFSLPICVIMGLTKSLSLWERWRRSRRRGLDDGLKCPLTRYRGSSPKGRALGCAQL